MTGEQALLCSELTLAGVPGPVAEVSALAGMAPARVRHGGEWAHEAVVVASIGDGVFMLESRWTEAGALWPWVPVPHDHAVFGDSPLRAAALLRNGSRRLVKTGRARGR